MGFPCIEFTLPAGKGNFVSFFLHWRHWGHWAVPFSTQCIVHPASLILYNDINRLTVGEASQCKCKYVETQLGTDRPYSHLKHLIPHVLYLILLRLLTVPLTARKLEEVRSAPVSIINPTPPQFTASHCFHQ